MAVLHTTDGPPVWAEQLFDLGQRLVKSAEDPTVVYNMSGRLYLSKSGWLLLSVPNTLVRGVFSAMKEPGIELPSHSDGTLEAHISVMSKQDVDGLGGPDVITERGKTFSYSLGQMYTVKPTTWANVSRVWYLKVISPELQTLRKSYGLTPFPNDNKYDFHVTVAIRRRGVLARNNTSKVEVRV